MSALKENLSTLESTDLLNVWDKTRIIALLAGHKPAAFFTINISENILEKVLSIKQLLTKLGLISLTSSNEEAKRIFFFVSRKQQTAETLKVAITSDPEDERVSGILLGFPKSAVDAFSRGNILSPQELTSIVQQLYPEELVDLQAFQHFVLSRDHWRDELDSIRAVAKSVQEYSPKIYEEARRLTSATLTKQKIKS